MEFAISAESQELAEAVRDYLSHAHGPSVLRDLDAGSGSAQDVWDGLVALGLPGLLVPEADGGLGRSLVDAALLARECGRAAVAAPLVDTAFVGVPWLLSRGETRDLQAIARGKKTVPLDHAVNPWIVGAAGDERASVDPLRPLGAAPDHRGHDDALLNLGALMTAAQLVGLAEAMLDQASAYARLRQQFGQPIGAFQAIKHKLADVAVELEFVRPVVWRAAQALDEKAASAAVHVSHAKYAASDAGYLAAESAIQVHGAMGYTYEVDLHYWMKRTWALVGAWGSRSFHFNRVEAAVRGGAIPLGPSHTFA
jgi:alkylation response protein AidB-like acyl-CoA dehydrogenase